MMNSMRWKIKVRFDRDGKKWTEVFYSTNILAVDAFKFILQAIERLPGLKRATTIGFAVEKLLWEKEKDDLAKKASLKKRKR